jgi:hypothetical protein
LYKFVYLALARGGDPERPQRDRLQHELCPVASALTRPTIMVSTSPMVIHPSSARTTGQGKHGLELFGQFLKWLIHDAILA